MERPPPPSSQPPQPSQPQRSSRTAAALHKSSVERARALTPEARILLALELGAFGRLLAGLRPPAPPVERR